MNAKHLALVIHLIFVQNIISAIAAAVDDAIVAVPTKCCIPSSLHASIHDVSSSTIFFYHHLMPTHLSSSTASMKSFLTIPSPGLLKCHFLATLGYKH